jgi:hypothetical protein
MEDDTMNTSQKPDDHKTPDNEHVAGKKTKPPENRAKYQRPIVTKHGNLKKITGLSFQPPE